MGRPTLSEALRIITACPNPARTVINGVGHYDLEKAAALHEAEAELNRRFEAWTDQVDPLQRRYLAEAPLSRVWRHVQDPSTAVGIISASRNENTAEQNAVQTRALSADIRRAGFGFFYVDGTWVENKGDPTEHKVSETSLFVTAPAPQAKVLRRQLEEWRQRYGQQSFLLKDAGTEEIQEISADATKSLGNWHPDKIGDAMTELRHRRGTFVFGNFGECTAWEPKNFISRLGVDAEWRRRFLFEQTKV